MTLMPVSNSSVFEESSSNSGGAWWMGRRSWVVAGPSPSIVSPTMLKTRPRVSVPTGTVTGEPVSRMSTPRWSPSVEPRAMARTRPPPRCWATSHQRVSRVVWPSTVRGTSTRRAL